MSSLVDPVNATTILFTALSLAALCPWLFARVFLIRTVGLDDCLIVVAWVKLIHNFSFTLDIQSRLIQIPLAAFMCLYAMRHAAGECLIEGVLENLGAFSVDLWLSGVLYPASVGFIKASICWFYTRLGHETLKRASYCMVGFIVAQTIAFSLSSAFHCPTSKLTHNPALPIPVILKLQMPSKQKVYILFILGLGLIACVASIVRLVYSAHLIQVPLDANAIAGTLYWSSIGMNLGIFAACFPSFKAIASRLFAQLIGEYPSNELQMPLAGGASYEDRPPRFLRRPWHTIGMSVLYSRNSDMGSPID